MANSSCLLVFFLLPLFVTHFAHLSKAAVGVERDFLDIKAVIPQCKRDIDCLNMCPKGCINHCSKGGCNCLCTPQCKKDRDCNKLCPKDCPKSKIKCTRYNCLCELKFCI